jgi:hypothetical protein
MKILFSIGMLLAVIGCQSKRGQFPTVISLTYNQFGIQKSFDTLYSNEQSAPGVYSGLIEQALAHCLYKGDSANKVTQDVFSSMYLNDSTNQYDCVTTTTFRFPDGTISATGVFNLVPGDTIAPDHDFPITGGSGKYRDSYGTYTRKYKNGVYNVKLQFYKTRREE